ncbi:hypothetical protein [Phenylobacterium aquaticum]|uniref:hypothetical protein n=1 Tax=Phenylobacterium aquaticum TaxID=1763816 RepID=UPI0026EB8C5B|nr:hypothetical protein [Phenylobacterium aquaticum]
MSDVVSFPRQVRRKKPTLGEALVFEIARSLQSYGGQAHRDVVIGDIARRAGFDHRSPPQELREDLIGAFDRGLNQGGLGHVRLFDLPFGAGSHRWRLADGALDANLRDPRFGDAG